MLNPGSNSGEGDDELYVREEKKFGLVRKEGRETDVECRHI